MKKLLFLLVVVMFAFNAKGQIIITVAGKGPTGSISDSGNLCSATSAKISDPYGVAFDSKGNLYFT